MSVDTLLQKHIDAAAEHAVAHAHGRREFRGLKSTPGGLTAAEAARRLDEFGPNELQAAGRISPWAILLEQFKNVLIIILLFATALSAFLGHGVEAIAITVIVLFAVVLGFVQEYRAERAIEALREMAAPTATVIRDGRERRSSGARTRPWRRHSPCDGRQGARRRAADRGRQPANGGGRADRRIRSRSKSTHARSKTSDCPRATGRTWSMQARP